MAFADLVAASFSRTVTCFDALGVGDKGFIAVLLDYSGIDRVRFASCWISETKKQSNVGRENTDNGPLLLDKGQG